MLSKLDVCDPLNLGYMLLPPIPDDLLGPFLVEVKEKNTEYFDAFFDSSGGYEEEQFRVMCWSCYPSMGAIFIYSLVSGSWTHGASICWDALGLLDAQAQLPNCIFLLNKLPSYAYGYLYWNEVTSDKLIRLNINNMELSTSNIPPDLENGYVVVVEAGEGRIGMFSLILEGYIFLIDHCRDHTRSAFFSLEVKTMKVERVSSSDCIHYHIIPYFGFPPSMSPRRM